VKVQASSSAWAIASTVVYVDGLMYFSSITVDFDKLFSALYCVLNIGVLDLVV
jgi:hypothetical protein